MFKQIFENKIGEKLTNINNSGKQAFEWMDKFRQQLDITEKIQQFSSNTTNSTDLQANNNNNNNNNNVNKIVIQQINRKIYSYKQQDIIKKLLNESEFITFDSIINKMVECELKCYYCSCEMNVLYDISREMTQWTVDRIDNDLGHNLTNYYLACLECNLKRRRRSDHKFLFTKQLKLVKLDRETEYKNTSLDKDTSLV